LVFNAAHVRISFRKTQETSYAANQNKVALLGRNGINNASEDDSKVNICADGDFPTQ
jgi:hypothetical protein